MSLVSSLPAVKGKYRENAKIGKMSWFNTIGEAEVLFIPEDSEDLCFFLKNKPKDIPIFVFGVGSNTLIRDGGIDGVVIRLGKGFNKLSLSEVEFNIITGAAVLDVNVATFCLENGITGLEFLSGIPGTIGGALAMNAGAYGNDISKVLVSAKAVNLNGELRTFNVDEIGYSYRKKGLGKEWIFYEAELQGQKGDAGLIEERINIIQAKRNETQPIKSRTAGSTFKNPDGFKAWELIDKAGCRGMKVGGAQVSTLHCNFLLNSDNATAKDIETLINTVKERVFKKFSIMLEEEILIVGKSY